jgi:imidazole glycerol-phosphate synthase subunit HisH
MKNNKFAIIDYHIGNIGSLENAFNRVGVDVNVTMDKQEILDASALILPGVGQFTEAIRNLHDSDLVSLLIDLAKAGKPMLGICLGMQLLMTHSEECDDYDGLNIVPGKVRRFTEPQPDSIQYKIPQIGWNSLLHPNKDSQSTNWEKTLLEGVDEGAQAYFLHSFMVETDNPKNIVAETNYGVDSLCSILRDDMVWGCQFHPERSGEVGQTILKNFVSLVASSSHTS